MTLGYRLRLATVGAALWLALASPALVLTVMAVLAGVEPVGYAALAVVALIQAVLLVGRPHSRLVWTGSVIVSLEYVVLSTFVLLQPGEFPPRSVLLAYISAAAVTAAVSAFGVRSARSAE